jgi:predicted transcriptional regulator
MSPRWEDRDMIVRDVMSKKLVTIPSQTNLRECAHKMNLLNVGVLPVSEQGKIIGLITDRDICCRGVGFGRDLETTKVMDIMSSHLTFCYDDQPCSAAAEQMKTKHIRRLLVQNRDHQTVGIITVDDLAHYSHALAGQAIDATSSLVY